MTACPGRPSPRGFPPAPPPSRWWGHLPIAGRLGDPDQGPHCSEPPPLAGDEGGTRPVPGRCEDRRGQVSGACIRHDRGVAWGRGCWSRASPAAPVSRARASAQDRGHPEAGGAVRTRGARQGDPGTVVSRALILGQPGLVQSLSLVSVFNRPLISLINGREMGSLCPLGPLGEPGSGGRGLGGRRSAPSSPCRRGDRGRPSTCRPASGRAPASLRGETPASRVPPCHAPAPLLTPITRPEHAPFPLTAAPAPRALVSAPCDGPRATLGLPGRPLPAVQAPSWALSVPIYFFP